MVIIFDLDGTLLDTYPVIKHTYQDVFQNHLPMHIYTEDDIRSYFGPPLQDTFLSVTKDEKEAMFLVEQYMKYSIPNHHRYLKAFPKAKEVCLRLKEAGHILAIASNKIRKHIDLGLAIVGMDELFDIIVGLDEVEHPKPHPEGVNRILRTYPDKKAIFIGDTLFDVETARNAGIPCIGVTWSHTPKETFLLHDAANTIDYFEELFDILEEFYV